MAALKVLASVSLIALAIAAQPARAANDGASNSGPGVGAPSTSPDGAAPHARHGKLSPEERAARRARRQARHQHRQQQQQQPGNGPG